MITNLITESTKHRASILSLVTLVHWYSTGGDSWGREGGTRVSKGQRDEGRKGRASGVSGGQVTTIASDHQ